MARKQHSYDEQFKQNIVQLFHNGKSQSQLSAEYGLSITAISRWVKLYSQVRLGDNTIISSQQDQIQTPHRLLHFYRFISPLQAYSLHESAFSLFRQTKAFQISSSSR